MNRHAQHKTMNVLPERVAIHAHGHEGVLGTGCAPLRPSGFGADDQDLEHYIILTNLFLLIV